jgi:hypothetical protein
MSIMIGGIACEEIVDGLEEGIDERGPRAVKKYLCAWSGRYTVANTFLGLVSHTGGAGGPIQLTAPLTYPESANMYAREIAIEGRGKPTQGTSQLQFPQAVVTVNYGVPQVSFHANPDQSLDPAAPYVYATQDIDFGREMVTIEKSAVKLANNNKLKDVPYAFPIAQAVMTIQLHRVPYLPAVQIIAALQRPLNNATFLGVTPGYLMFNGARSHEEASSDGRLTRSITYVFAYRPILRWDEVFDPDGVSGPQQVRYNGAAVLLRSDLSLLIPAAYHG